MRGRRVGLAYWQVDSLKSPILIEYQECRKNIRLLPICNEFSAESVLFCDVAGWPPMRLTEIPEWIDLAHTETNG